jgi:hypothetical protein
VVEEDDVVEVEDKEVLLKKALHKKVLLAVKVEKRSVLTVETEVEAVVGVEIVRGLARGRLLSKLFGIGVLTPEQDEAKAVVS